VTESREPRTFHKTSNAPPTDVLLRDQDGDLIACGEPGGWRYVEVKGEKTATSGADGCSWADLDDEFDVSWPLVEVLPDPTPEAKSGDRVIATQFGRVHEAVEGVLEAPENLVDEPATVRRDDGVRIYIKEVVEVLTAVPASSSVRGASVSSPVSEDADTPVQAVSDELRVELAKLIAGEGADLVHDDSAVTYLDAADAILRAGWRPPMPQWKQDLNDGIGIDDTKRIYTEADLVKAYSDAMKRERDGQTVEWGYRRVGELDDMIRKATAAEAQAVNQREGFEGVYRLVHPWKADED